MTAFATDKKRSYWQCNVCHLVFADPTSWPSPTQEKAEYDLHENHLKDPGYNRFLSRIVEPVLTHVSEHSELLDFGCGPAPALIEQFRQRGLQASGYDIFYQPDPQRLLQQYDAITLTEVIEHLHHPWQTLQQLWALLRPQGVLAIMTQRVINAERFQRWTYKNDPTHICFYHQNTFHWLARALEATDIEFIDRDIVILKR